MLRRGPTRASASDSGWRRLHFAVSWLEWYPAPASSARHTVSDLPRERLQSSLGAAYTLERELHGGGMSRVFVARDTALERDVVIKVLAAELAEGLSAERFAREIRLAARCRSRTSCRC